MYIGTNPVNASYSKNVRNKAFKPLTLHNKKPPLNPQHRRLTSFCTIMKYPKTLLVQFYYNDPQGRDEGVYC